MPIPFSNSPNDCFVKKLHPDPVFLKRYLGILILLLAVVGLTVWLWPTKPTVPTPNNESAGSQPAPPVTKEVKALQDSWVNNAREQLPAVDPQKYDPILPQWEEWRRRNKEDRFWEWKMPIHFYGKVVEYTTEEPISGVEIVITWTDLSPTGGSRRMLYSDAQGRFSLTGITGKGLVVQELEKDGYIRSNIGSNFGFEYSAFFEETYHQPDPDNPVIFRMKKKGDAEPLVYRQAEITVGVNHVGAVQIDPQTVLQVELIANGEIREKNWVAKVNVLGGGVQVSTEEFPFTAPEDGYQSSLTLDLKTPKPDNWTQMYQGGQFYVKTANGQYGRIELKTVSGKTFMRYSLFLNPTPSNRNLEYDPKKSLK